MSNKKILICDDDQGILDMLNFILEDEYVVISEPNSLNVSSIIEKQEPDLILLDLWMPVLSGDLVLKSVRKNQKTKNLPVIIMSASTDGEKIANASGADDYIAKPFDIDTLINRIQKLI